MSMEVYKKEATELEEQLLILRKQGRPEEILQKASRLLEIAQLHQDSYYIAAALYFQAYYEFSRGIDLRPVEAVRIRKSVGCEHTLEKDISQQSSVIIELYHVATELIERLQRTGFKGNTLTLKIKFHDFNQKTRSITQSHELTTLAEILPLAKGLLKDIEYTTHPIRLIGLSVSNPYEKNEEKARWEQLSFEFSDWDYSK